jgi:hypothetical protein
MRNKWSCLLLDISDSSHKPLHNYRRASNLPSSLTFNVEVTSQLCYEVHKTSLGRAQGFVNSALIHHIEVNKPKLQSLQPSRNRTQNLSRFSLFMFTLMVQESRLVGLMPKFGYGAQNLYLVKIPRLLIDRQSHYPLFQCIQALSWLSDGPFRVGGLPVEVMIWLLWFGTWTRKFAMVLYTLCYRVIAFTVQNSPR